MKNLFCLFFAFCLAAALSPGHAQKDNLNQNKTQIDTSVNSDSANMSLLMSHLREHFDDLHDVIMRFHHQDPALKGVIALDMLWQDKKLISCTTKINETGNDSLAEGLIEKIRAWEIDGLDGPYKTVLPVRVRIVGSDEPDFPNRAILTGYAEDTSGKPVQNAVIVLHSLTDPEVRVPEARTNSEGIFIRTLIPPGEYQFLCIPAESDTVFIGTRTFYKGEHKKEHLVITGKLLNDSLEKQ